jgi:hypothetical protein
MLVEEVAEGHNTQEEVWKDKNQKGSEKDCFANSLAVHKFSKKSKQIIQ